MPRKRARKKTASRSGKVKNLTIRAMHPGGDLVSIQISARLKRVPKGMKITKSLLADMVRRKAASSAGFWDGSRVIGAAEGSDPPGIELRIKAWKNPTRRKSGDRGWRKGTQSAAWGSLRYALAAAAISFR